MLLISDQNDLKRTKYNTAITYKSSPSFLYILYSVHTFFFCKQFALTWWFFLFISLFFSFLQGKKRGCVWKIIESGPAALTPAGPRGALRRHETAALSSHRCWPENCGCCGLPCREWRTLGLWNSWAGDRQVKNTNDYMHREKMQRYRALCYRYEMIF